jgi:hypothetical protein
MSSAIAGLIGAAIGALAGVTGAFISQRMQARATRERALLSKKEEAYSSTLRYLLRAQNRRSAISAESGQPYIGEEAVIEVFDDLVEAQFWASSLTIYCSEEQRETVKKVSRDLNEAVANFVSGESIRSRLKEKKSAL